MLLHVIRSGIIFIVYGEFGKCPIRVRINLAFLYYHFITVQFFVHADSGIDPIFTFFTSVFYSMLFHSNVFLFFIYFMLSRCSEDITIYIMTGVIFIHPRIHAVYVLYMYHCAFHMPFNVLIYYSSLLVRLHSLMWFVLCLPYLYINYTQVHCSKAAIFDGATRYLGVHVYATQCPAIMGISIYNNIELFYDGNRIHIATPKCQDQAISSLPL